MVAGNKAEFEKLVTHFAKLADGLDEEGFLRAAIDAIGEVKKTPQNTLD